MRYITTILLSVYAVCLFSQICSYSNLTYKEGEKLTYQLSYNLGFVGVPAGEVTFEVFENEDEYFVEVIGKTYESYNTFFKVDDYFSSVIDKETGRPKTFIRNIHEGNYTFFDSISFAHDRFNASGKIGRTETLAKNYSMDISDCVHDIISILYAMRNENLYDLKDSDNLKFTVFFDNEEYPLELEYRGVQQKEIEELGSRSCHLIVPEVVAGEVFDEDSRMSVWVSSDKNQVPLLIESPVSIGSVKAVLIDSKNLKY